MSNLVSIKFALGRRFYISIKRMSKAQKGKKISASTKGDARKQRWISDSIISVDSDKRVHRTWRIPNIEDLVGNSIINGFTPREQKDMPPLKLSLGFT